MAGERILSLRTVRNLISTSQRRPDMPLDVSRKVLAACHASLRAHEEGRLKLDPDVRLPLDAVVRCIHRVRNHAQQVQRDHNESPYL